MGAPTVTRNLAEALIRVRNSPEFAPLRQYLLDLQLWHGELLVSAEEDRKLHLTQGAARLLRHLTELIEDAPALLEKTRQPQTAGVRV